MPPHIMAIAARKVNLNNRLMGFIVPMFPARAFRASGRRIMINAIGRNHIKPNKTLRSRTFLRLRASGLFMMLNMNSRVANGSTKIKPAIAADLKLVRKFFMASLWVI